MTLIPESAPVVEFMTGMAEKERAAKLTCDELLFDPDLECRCEMALCGSKPGAPVGWLS